MNLKTSPDWDEKRRVNVLESFGASLVLWIGAGHFVLGFEGPWIYTPIMILTALCTALVLETLDAKLQKRTARYLQSDLQKKGFFLPPFISGLNASMLIYAGELILPIILVASAAVCSKVIFRVQLNSGRLCHFLNPSNSGLCLAFFLFEEVGAVPPYQYSAITPNLGEIFIPIMGIAFGLLLNIKTGRLPLVISFHACFFLQAILRMAFFSPETYSTLYTMTGPAFILFSLFMIPDPGTTPLRKDAQILFGAAVALVYALLQLTDIVYGPFYALFIVNAMRGIILSVSREAI
jgi:enediyne biosynthesis protein E5